MAGRRAVQDGAGKTVLIAGCVSAALSWVSLTMVALLDRGLVLLIAVACIIAGVAVAIRESGRQRRLAVLGGMVALLPLLVVAGFLATSEG